MARKVNNTMVDTLMLVGGGVVGAGLAFCLLVFGVKSRKKMLHLGKVMSKKSERAFDNFTDSMSDFADTMSSRRGKSQVLCTGGNYCR